MVLLVAGAVAMSAVAAGHGDHSMAGEQLENAVTKMAANSLEALFRERARRFTNDNNSQNSCSTDKLGSHRGGASVIAQPIPGSSGRL